MPFREIARELQGKAANLAVRLPIAWVNLLAGAPVNVDGRTLDVRAQWLIEVLGRSGQPPVERTSVLEARANYDATVATYRLTILTAFQQVEDALAQQRILVQQEKVQRAAVAASREAERLSLNQYRVGTVPYTTVVQTQATALAAEQTLLTIRFNRLVASANLVKALGGGWQQADLPAVTPIGGLKQANPAPPALPTPPPQPAPPQVTPTVSATR